MLKYLLIPVAAGLFGAAGYFGGQMLAPAPEPEKPMEEASAAAVEAKPMLFKMPLGKVTIQIIKPKKILHMLIDLDIYVKGAAAFESINGAMGRAKLRDLTVTTVAQLAETELWMLEEDTSEQSKRRLSEYIVREIYKTYPEVRTARINRISYNSSARY